MQLLSKSKSNRREFLAGKPVRETVEEVGDKLADAIVGLPLDAAPSGGDTIRLTQRTMACDFSVIMNPGPMKRVMMASDALDLIKEMEDQLTVYSDTSEVARLNASAATSDVAVEESLFALIKTAKQIYTDTDGAFDPTAGPLIGLWQRSRKANRIPSDDEIRMCLNIVGMHHVNLNESDIAVRYAKPGIEINFGAIGKGHALDCASNRLQDHGLDSFLLHGGHSSILARGQHLDMEGWPVGIGNPLFTDRRLGSIVLSNQAMSTSGSNIQYFRYQGKRYGHILDPRDGWPVDGILSATVIADDATHADALSTAFYVMGMDAAIEYCTAHREIGAILVPQPKKDRRVRPIVLGLSPERLFWDQDQVLVEHR